MNVLLLAVLLSMGATDAPHALRVEGVGEFRVEGACEVREDGLRCWDAQGRASETVAGGAGAVFRSTTARAQMGAQTRYVMVSSPSKQEDGSPSDSTTSITGVERAVGATAKTNEGRTWSAHLVLEADRGQATHVSVRCLAPAGSPVTSSLAAGAQVALLGGRVGEWKAAPFVGSRGGGKGMAWVAAFAPTKQMTTRLKVLDSRGRPISYVDDLGRPTDKPGRPAWIRLDHHEGKSVLRSTVDPALGLEVSVQELRHTEAELAVGRLDPVEDVPSFAVRYAPPRLHRAKSSIPTTALRAARSVELGDAGVVRLEGVCQVEADDMTCWDASGRPSPDMTRRMDAHFRQAAIDLYPGWKNRHVVVSAPNQQGPVRFQRAAPEHEGSAVMGCWGDPFPGRSVYAIHVATRPDAKRAGVVLEFSTLPTGKLELGELKPGAGLPGPEGPIRVGTPIEVAGTWPTPHRVWHYPLTGVTQGYVFEAGALLPDRSVPGPVDRDGNLRVELAPQDMHPNGSLLVSTHGGETVLVSPYHPKTKLQVVLSWQRFWTVTLSGAPMDPR